MDNVQKGYKQTKHTNSVAFNQKANYTDQRPQQTANLVPTIAETRCCVVRATDSYGH
jgi:hypothetical protein